MKGKSKLLEIEDHWPSMMGGAIPGERVVYRGKDLLNELNTMSWMQLYLYGITGRIFSENEIKLFEGIWVISTSYPDARLWNNRIASLAGTCRSTGSLGVSAAIASCEASVYGQSPVIKCMEFLRITSEKLDAGLNLDLIIRQHLKQHRVIPGYGRPIVNRDERIQPLLELARKLGLADGGHVKLAFDIETSLLQGRWRMHMNVAALACALVTDIGLSEREFYLFLIPSFSAGIVPCFIEASTRPEGGFLPIRCNRIQYEGTPKRKWASTAL